MPTRCPTRYVISAASPSQQRPHHQRYIKAVCSSSTNTCTFKSSALYSTYLQVRQLSSSVIRTAHLRSLPWIVASLLSTSNSTVLPKPSRSSRSESLLLISQQPNLSRCQNQVRSFLIVFLPAVMFILTSRILSRLRAIC